MNTVTEGAGVLEVVTTQKEFPRPPAGEAITGTIAGWKNLGKQTVTFKGKTKVINKIAVKIYLDCLDPETGENITSYASFNASTHEKSGLVSFLKSLTGTDFSNKPVNVLETIGITASFVFEDNISKSNGRTYSNIKSVFRSRNQKPFPVPANFVAFKPEDSLPEGATEIHKSAIKVTEVTEI